MTQSDLNRAVALATGESVQTIARLGFVPLALGPIDRQKRTVRRDRPRPSRLRPASAQRQR